MGRKVGRGGGGVLRVSDLGVLLLGLSFLLLQPAPLRLQPLEEVLQVAVGALQRLFLGQQAHHVLLQPSRLLPGCRSLRLGVPSLLGELALLAFRLERGGEMFCLRSAAPHG